jgi:hypothetical protein
LLREQNHGVFHVIVNSEVVLDLSELDSLTVELDLCVFSANIGQGA